MSTATYNEVHSNFEHFFNRVIDDADTFVIQRNYLFVFSMSLGRITGCE